MKYLPRSLQTTALVFAVALAILFSAVVPSARAALREEWLPVTPAELALAAPSVEPDADAEALFWDVRVQDRDTASDIKSVVNNYVRVKVFNDRGKESQSKIEIAYGSGTKVANIEGRTIKKDGTIVELKPDAIFDRTIVKFGNFKVNVKSFAMPAVESGCIIEYRWQETSPARLYQRLALQRDIPVQKITYHIKPFSSPGFELGMRMKVFNGETSRLEKEGGGYYRTETSNVKAFREEPHMPPEDQVRSWILLFYSEDLGVTADKYWTDYGKRVFNRSKGYFKVTDEIRRATAEVTAGATTDDDKIRRIHTFCRTKIKNLGDDAAGLTDEERKKIRENNNANDTLKQMRGYPDDINAVFAAMCLAAGLDARPAALSDRSDFFFDPSFPDSYFLQAIDIAVKNGNEWRVYDPGYTYAPPGMLTWREENTQALIADPKEPVWIRAQLSLADVTTEKRTGTFTLSEDGTLEGDVQIEYTGHLGIDWKEFHDDDSPEQREASILEDVRKRLSTAEVSKIKVENVTDHEKPFSVTYHVRIPGFAQRTGKRLFFQPSFFQVNVGPRFTATTRQHLIYFHYPWTEDDKVTVTLPPGYELDSADQPESFSVGAVGGYDVKILASKDGSIIQYQRKFAFAADGSLYFPASGYVQIKKVFDAIHERDNHMLTLRLKATQ